MTETICEALHWLAEKMRVRSGFLILDRMSSAISSSSDSMHSNATGRSCSSMTQSASSAKSWASRAAAFLRSGDHAK